MRLTVWELIALWLAQRHRRRQDEIANTVASAVARSWRYMDFERLDETTPLWVDVAEPSIQYGFERSQMATASFIRDYRAVAALSADVDADIDPLPKIVTARAFANAVNAPPEGREPAPEFDADRMARIIAAAGPGRVKRSLPTTKERAMAIGMRGAAGAAVAQAMDGGRGVTLLETRRDTKRALGYQRMTDGDPCAFCAILAANGPQFSRKSFQESNSERHLTRRAQRNVKFVPNSDYGPTGEPDSIAKVHDHCRCTLVPVYSEFDLIDPVGQIAAQLWAVSTKNRSSDEAFKHYSKLYRQIRKDAGPLTELDIDSEEIRSVIEAELKNIDGNTSGARFLRSVSRAA